MRSAYVAALGSYAARANASWTGRALVGSNLVMAGATAAWSSAEPNLAQSMLMPTAFLAGLLFLHFKECATVPPAGTWPGYRRAHALAAATLAVAVCIAWPAAVTVRTGWPGVGLVATMLALTAAVA
ncbi:MAG TPA: hypothetical protein VK324_10725, partial [Tepidisphaeraceae bacterium]|nr:hypothetical protein [Tepidisphaeraceae bacterium]